MFEFSYKIDPIAPNFKVGVDLWIPPLTADVASKFALTSDQRQELWDAGYSAAVLPTLFRVVENKEVLVNKWWETSRTFLLHAKVLHWRSMTHSWLPTERLYAFFKLVLELADKDVCHRPIVFNHNRANLFLELATRILASSP